MSTQHIGPSMKEIFSEVSTAAKPLTERFLLIHVATQIHAACVGNPANALAEVEDSVLEAASLINAVDEFLAVRSKDSE